MDTKLIHEDIEYIGTLSRSAWGMVMARQHNAHKQDSDHISLEQRFSIVFSVKQLVNKCIRTRMEVRAHTSGAISTY